MSSIYRTRLEKAGKTSLAHFGLRRLECSGSSRLLGARKGRRGEPRLHRHRLRDRQPEPGLGLLGRLVRVRDGQIVHAAGTLIRPPAKFSDFSGFNTKVHGITAAMVAEAPPWRQVAVDPRLRRGQPPGCPQRLIRHERAAAGMRSRKRYRRRTTTTCARWRWPGKPATAPPTSCGCRRQFGIGFTAHHNASAGDARCAAQVAVAMARRHGHDKLEQLAQSFHVPVGHLAT